MATEVARSSTASARGRPSAEDFETASIRSAAPSYTSDAPSYHSVAPHPEPVPPYSPPASRSASGSTSAPPAASSSNSNSNTNAHSRVNSGTSAHPSRAAPGLPRIPSGLPRRQAARLPSLDEFRIPTWSSVSASPNARHYHSVAQRRVAAANTASDPLQCARRMLLERVDEEWRRNRVRPLEDPYLVGEEAAARARAERLARENTADVLVLDDKRWDWFLAQTKEFRRGVRNGSQGKLARRIGAL
ncbi:hypothetical protein QBC33DRAFT_557460 [Phialemonium atrogriseum]|uniref:Uncharacterized protein n=1 Tax=Phialemonium atrogriseum TaxID=1093897 RepID=A0AAJ0C4R9_9PEZI|nr:uncharacterized protein QBC33DRAFT_557460 [Phialemonium atrogriseum]KAK1768682.1 hypothetical protein QBC33DRAFT_557460 [Phialemonium atrogriseum]